MLCSTLRDFGTMDLSQVNRLRNLTPQVNTIFLEVVLHHLDFDRMIDRMFLASISPAAKAHEHAKTNRPCCAAHEYLDRQAK